MQIPSSGFIEIAKDQLEKLSPQQVKEQQAEYLLVKPDSSISEQYGYQLGLQTARVMLETSTYLAQKGVRSDDLL
jgi:hypothetical protein